MNKKMKVLFEKISYDEIEIDFNQIYDYVKRDLEKDDATENDKWAIVDHFCINMDAYIKEIYGYKICTLEEADTHNGPVMDGISEEFSEWMKKQINLGNNIVKN